MRHRWVKVKWANEPTSDIINGGGKGNWGCSNGADEESRFTITQSEGATIVPHHNEGLENLQLASSPCADNSNINLPDLSGLANNFLALYLRSDGSGNGPNRAMKTAQNAA
jgi:hypothetical protein